jgi:hypothetical protein
LAAAAALLAAGPGVANAATTTLDFEGVVPNPLLYGESYPAVLDYYNGGTSEALTSGPNLGVSFSSGALALHCEGSNTAKGGVGPGSSRFTAIFLVEPSVTINVAAGFDTGLAFTYATLLTGRAEVFDGLDGTGSSLGFLDLATTPSTCSPAVRADYCPFIATGFGFAGTGRSVVLSGFTNSMVFDDLTFGSASIAALPEPASWAMLLFGFCGLGMAMRRRGRPATA